MSEATITIAKVFTATGTGKNGKWTRYDIKPGEDENVRYKTFNDDIGKLAQEHEGTGAQFTVEYDEDEYGLKATKLSGPVTQGNGDGPAPLPRSKTAREDQTAVNARKALEEAVKAMPQFPNEPKSTNYTLLAGFFFEFLQEKCGGTSEPEPEPQVDPSAEGIPF